MHRGNCSFVTKANVAEAAGASALLIINNQTGQFSVSIAQFFQIRDHDSVIAFLLPEHRLQFQLK